MGVALGGAMGVACWEVIGYHIKNPYHFSFQRYYMKCVFGVHPVLNAPEPEPSALLQQRLHTYKEVISVTSSTGTLINTAKQKIG